jgi:glycosyltransferase involved in cell wall biosynthesis
MWTFNGGKVLAPVLANLNKVIPSEMVGKKFIVDDHSTDNTREIARRYGWQVYFNRGKGISDGANTALSLIESDCFCSFEQDVILSPEWWPKIAAPFFDSDLSASSGMRFSSQPQGVTTLFRYVAKKYRGEQLSPWLNSRRENAFTLGKTLDNTIYRTKDIRAVGGFPNLKVNAGIDTVLAWKLGKKGFKWKVDYNVQSIHLRTGLKDELNHQKWYGTQTYAIQKELDKVGIKSPINLRKILFRLVLAPFSGIFVALKTREATIVYIHPLIRLYYAMGLFEKTKKTQSYRCPLCQAVVLKLFMLHSKRMFVCETCLTNARDVLNENVFSITKQ